MNLIYAVTVV